MGRTNLDIAIAKLKQEIKICEEYKNRILKHVQKIKNKCINKEITYYEYEILINKKLDNKTIHEWIEHYNSHIKKCEKKIIKEVRKFKVKRVLPIILLSFILISLLVLVVFYTTPAIVGFITQEQIQTHTKTLNLKFTESQNYEWQLENPGQLDSVEISGLIEGEGQVKVYLDDLLILDSSSIKPKKAGITGETIIETEQERSIIEFILGFFQKTLLTITGRVAEETRDSGGDTGGESSSEGSS